MTDQGQEVARVFRWTLWRIAGRLVWKHDLDWLEPARFERLTAAASHADYERHRRAKCFRRTKIE